MKHVRLGIVGLGNIGKFHAGYLLEKKISRCELTAVSDAFAPGLAPYLNRPGLQTFASCEEMIRSGAIDALIVATPHFLHTTIGIDALKNGLHVMVEKPISAHKADAERLIAVAQAHPKQVFGGMFQMRVEPRYQKIKQLLASADFGQLTRVNWIITDWFRTEAYYASGGWRATWKGEGGGVLLNQCLHQLDVLQWMCGMPKTVRGFCQLGRFHNIEVEDNITTFMEWANGATGVFISSTGEAPGTNRLELCGTRGKLVVEDNKLRFTRNDADMIEFSKTSKSGFAKPEVWHPQPARHPHPELRGRHPRRHAAHRAGRGRHGFRGAGKRAALLLAHQPEHRAADGQPGVGEQAQRTHRQLAPREESRGEHGGGFHEVV